MISDKTLGTLVNFFADHPQKTYGKNETILNAEENPPGVFYLEEGFVRFYAISPDGKELTLNIFKPGSFFPMTWALGEKPNVYFFETMTAVNLRLAPKDQFLEFLKAEPEIFYDFNKRIMVGLYGFLTRVEYLLFGNASQRVISVLLMAGQRFGLKKEGGQMEIQLPLTHQSIADLAGLTRESTSIEMKKLERKGLISSKNKLIKLLDPEKMRNMCLLCREEGPLPYAF